MSFLQNQFEKNVLVTSVDYVFNWARQSSIWPLTFGLACCAIEMIASSAATSSCFVLNRLHCAWGFGPIMISMRLGGNGSVPLSLRPAWAEMKRTSGNSRASSRIRRPKAAVCRNRKKKCGNAK